MPRLVAAPVNVVEDKNVKIAEFFGGASCNPCPFPVGDISVAHVHAKAGWAEDWQTPAFDEYVLVLKGTIKIVTAHGETKVSGGQAVFLPKGERVQWVFEEEAEYVPICLPAFSPSNVHREEAADKPPVHDSHTTIYHLVQKPLWEETKAKGGVYYPPTYEEDGFTHATADPKYLIGVANHFYKETKAEWLCLKMTRASLFEAGITLKFESPSPVGSTPALTDEQSGGERFPHIYGGIPATGGVVLEETSVQREADGTFVGITGLC